MKNLEMEYGSFICIIIFYLILCIRFRKEFLMLILHYVYICSWLFALTTFSTQPQPWLDFLQSEAGSNNKRDKTKSSKHQSHEGGIIVSEIDKYIVSFFFDNKGLELC